MRVIGRKSLFLLVIISLVLFVLPPIQLLASTTRYEETDPGVVYGGTWEVKSYPQASGGSYKGSKTTGNSVSFTFNGPSITWIGIKAANRGKAKVYVDGALDATVDLYSTTLLWQQNLFTKSGLPLGAHTIRIEIAGEKNASSTDFWVDLDAFDVDDGSPSNVQISAPTTGGSLIINWTNPPISNFSHVEIERKDARYGETRILPDKFTSSPAEDKNLAAGIEYSYRLRAVDTSGKSTPWTSSVSATPYGMAPTDVNVENEGSGGKLVISWINPPTGTYDFVRIYRSSMAGSLGVPVSMDRIDGTSYVDTGLANGTTYYYALRSVDFAGKESLNTDQHSGVPSVSQTRYEETSPSVTFSGAWNDTFHTNYSGGSSKVTNAIRATAKFTFTSNSIAWLAARASNRGIARVLIDDIYQAAIDLYLPSTVFQQKVYTRTGLTNTTHTLTIEVTGTKNPSSSDTYVDVDAFDFDATPSAGTSLPAPVVAGATVGSGEIVGRVINRAGQTIPGTAVRVNATVVPTNPGGEFRFTLVSSGVYTVYYDAPGYRGQTQVIEVKSGQSTRCPTVIMDPGITPSVQGEIYGRVVNPAHQPLAGAAVRINSVVIPTNAAGEFRFQLVNPGVYTVYYDAAGYAGQTQMLEVKAGMVTYPPMVIMSGTLGEIYGRVLDVGTRRAIPGTAVRVNGVVAPTNPGGEFRFTLVHPGIYKVYYDAPGYRGQVQEVVAVFAGTTTICPAVLMSR